MKRLDQDYYDAGDEPKPVPSLILVVLVILAAVVGFILGFQFIQYFA